MNIIVKILILIVIFLVGIAILPGLPPYDVNFDTWHVPEQELSGNLKPDFIIKEVETLPEEVKGANSPIIKVLV